MYQATGNSLYLDYAEGAARWLIASMVPENGGKYIEYNPDHQAAHGVQPGREAQAAAFLLHLYAETGNTDYLDAAEEIGQWLVNSAIPDNGGYKWVNGYPYITWYIISYQGASGVAGFLYELYEITGNGTYLEYANGAVQWIISQAIVNGDTAKWPRKQGDTAYQLVNYHMPEFEFIGSILLKAYSITADTTYLEYASKNANWIISQAVPEGERYKYPASETDSTFCAWRNAAIAKFLMSLYNETGENTYRQHAEGAFNWIVQEALEEDNGYKWAPCSSWRVDMGLYEAQFGDGVSGIGYNLLFLNQLVP